jgi:hypothetical protein
MSRRRTSYLRQAQHDDYMKSVNRLYSLDEIDTKVVIKNKSAKKPRKIKRHD